MIPVSGYLAVMRTKVFKSGNSQAVRIPAEFAYADTDAPFEITRTGDVITIYPAHGNLRLAVELLRNMPKPPSIGEIDRTRTRDTADD
jgi:antitoxin VapB